jgi:comEA protein
MSIFSVLQQSFGFTRNEIKVILFLTTTFIIGLAIRWYGLHEEPKALSKPQYDYSLEDQEFKERSQKLEKLISPEGEKLSEPRRKSEHTLQPHSININTASKDQLAMLPGIGETYAERIIEYRNGNGPYASVDGLKNVKGIGKHTLERLRPYVIVR